MESNILYLQLIVRHLLAVGRNGTLCSYVLYSLLSLCTLCPLFYCLLSALLSCALLSSNVLCSTLLYQTGIAGRSKISLI